MTIVYDAQALGTFRTLMTLRGTMLPMVFSSPIFYTLVLSHVVLIAMHEGQLPLPRLSFSAVGTVTGLLTFFIVFYGSQSYSRLNMFFGHCVGIGGAVMEWTALVRNHFPEQAVDAKWNAVRLVLAAVHVHYYTLNASDGGSAISGDAPQRREGNTSHQSRLATWGSHQSPHTTRLRRL